MYISNYMLTPNSPQKKILPASLRDIARGPAVTQAGVFSNCSWLGAASRQGGARESAGLG
jgi:hypothetical protein